jgi:hypothetical protein
MERSRAVDIMTSVNVSLAMSRYRFLSAKISGENPEKIPCVITSTRGFAAKEEPGVAVCLLPGTELAFEHEVKYNRYWLLTRSTDFCVARFCAIEPRGPDQHHDALAFPDGNIVLVNMLSEGQHARVLQLPVIRQGQNVDAHAQKTVILALDPEVTA